MKYTISLFLSLWIVTSGSAQRMEGGAIPQRITELRTAGTRFVPVELFTSVASSATNDALWNKACKDASLVRLDKAGTTRLIAGRLPYISLSIPSAQGNVVLDLEQVDITTDEFNVKLASGNRSEGAISGLHYRGMINGTPGSLVAISIYEDEVMGLISDGTGERVLGRLDNDRDGIHIFYHENDLRATNSATCGTLDVSPEHHQTPGFEGDASRTTKCVRFYWEVNYDVYLNKNSSVTQTTNYITALFNQTAVLFSNDGIDVLLNEVFVWDVASPYTFSSTSEQLDQFGTTRTSFNGDMAHLIGLSGNGGIAWLNTLCSATTRYRMGYSGIYSSFSNVPTYSWTVEVVTHEEGHNLGSQHTHACAWNGNATRIDGCGPAAGYNNEGTCTAGPVPTGAVGGTIMSYCHLVSGVGINFANGFGPLPAARIIAAVNGASCLISCGTSCDPPSNRVAYGITLTGATLSWAALGVTSYTLQWKPVANSTWTTVSGLTGTTYVLTGLTNSTAYEFRVLSVCGASSSAYSASVTFTTNTPCPDIMEPNNTTATAGTVVIPVNVYALLATSSDVDFYKFVLTNAGTITMGISNLAGDYDLRLLNSSGTQVAISENGGTQSESISYVAAAGTYYAHVYGFGGAFSAEQCYNLTIYATGQTCQSPSDLNTNNIVYNGAQLNWNTVQGATSYQLQYRVAPSGNWTNMGPVTQTNFIVSGLQASTDYNWQVAQNCPGGTGGFSGIANFTTLAAPCEVSPTALVALKVILGGPFDGTSLMNDGLRSNNIIPTTEPYTLMGYSPTGTLVADGLVFATTGNNAIVDWVLVELRNTTSPYAVVESRVGLLQRDGDVVAVNGTSALGFCVAAGSYRVSVRHRNHLGCMTGQAYALSAVVASIDLTVSGTATYGTNARKTVGSKMVLWSGNTVPDQTLLYTGANNDRDLILSAIGGVVPTNTASGYLFADVNMDGQVIYTGANNDRDIILGNIGGVVPTATVVQQLP